MPIFKVLRRLLEIPYSSGLAMMVSCCAETLKTIIKVDQNRSFFIGLSEN